jgi:cellulose synthase/poly-beta-1,6-N-acetylglucosamine synthase-like glycosyltransferase
MIGRLLARGLFWTSLALIVHTLIVMPLLLVARALVRPATATPNAGRPAGPARVTVVIAAHDEEPVIAQKIGNTLALDHPRELLDIVLACDGCTDATARVARQAARARDAADRLEVLEVPRGGKNAALRAALARAEGDLLLFTDADARLAPDALRHLIAPLADPAVGGTAGRVVHDPAGGPSGERSYWRAEDLLRTLQSRAGSMTSAAGVIYMVRRELVVAPPDGVTDDFWISVQVPLSGRRLLFVPEARADVPAAPALEDEFRRKVRIICAGLRGVLATRSRFRGRFIDLQVVTHKALRRLLVAPGLVAVACGLRLARHGRVYAGVGVAGLAVILAGAWAWSVRRRPLGEHPAVAAAAHAAATSAASLVALRDLVRGERHDRWRHRG